jgi:hypothetical protein
VRPPELRPVLRRGGQAGKQENQIEQEEASHSRLDLGEDQSRRDCREGP